MDFGKTERVRDDYSYREYISGERGGSVNIHDAYEIVYIVRGSLTYEVEGHEYRAASGDVIFTAPGELHEITLTDNGLYTRQTLMFKAGFLSGRFPEIPAFLSDRKPGESSLISSGLVKKHGIDTIFSQLHQYAGDTRPETEMLFLSYTALLMIKISGIIKYESPDMGRQLKKNVRSITDYINDNLTERLTLDKIAGHLYLDKSYMCRIFKNETGVTINTYINMQRVSAAKSLLLAGTMPGEACGLCGFNDYSTFYRAFRRHAGMTPEEFVRRGREF